MHTYKLANSIFDGPITNLLSILCILIEAFSRANAKAGGGAGGGGGGGEWSLNDLNFATFNGLFRATVRQV